MKFWLCCAGVCLLLSIIIGFNAWQYHQINAAAEVLRLQRRHEFREKLAALRVATDSCTYSEFRERMLDLETSFTCNQLYLPDLTNSFAELDQLMHACDSCWSFSISHPTWPVLHRDYEPLDAILVICPLYTNTMQTERREDVNGDPNPRFLARPYVITGLTEVSVDSDILLKRLGD